jgi:hypothetical protein
MGMGMGMGMGIWCGVRLAQSFTAPAVTPAAT